MVKSELTTSITPEVKETSPNADVQEGCSGVRKGGASSHNIKEIKQPHLLLLRSRKLPQMQMCRKAAQGSEKEGHHLIILKR